MRTFIRLSALAALTLSAPAFAEPAHGQDAPAAHGDAHAPADAHGDAEHGEEDHGGGHHIRYMADDDADGTANWRDSTNGNEPNEESYAAGGLFFHAINLALLFALGLWAVRTPVLDGLRARALGIRKTLNDSAKVRDEASEKHAKVLIRLEKLAEEVASMKAQAAEDAKTEHAALLVRAHEEAEHIQTLADRNIRDEVARARSTLRRDAVELAIELAENTLRSDIGTDDQKRLSQEFLDTLNIDGKAANART